MSLDKILRALESEAEDEIAAIEGETEWQIERIRADAERASAAARAKHLPALHAPLQAERARILNQARQEAVRVLSGEREALIAQALQAAAGQLSALPGSSMYARVMDELACEAISTLGQMGRLRLKVAGEDEEMTARIVRERSLPAEVEKGIEENPAWPCTGGLIATSPDGRITLVNTLSARLERAGTLHRAKIAEMLFGPDGEG